RLQGQRSEGWIGMGLERKPVDGGRAAGASERCSQCAQSGPLVVASEELDASAGEMRRHACLEGILLHRGGQLGTIRLGPFTQPFAGVQAMGVPALPPNSVDHPMQLQFVDRPWPKYTPPTVTEYVCGNDG